MKLTHSQLNAIAYKHIGYFNGTHETFARAVEQEVTKNVLTVMAAKIRNERLGTVQPARIYNTNEVLQILRVMQNGTADLLEYEAKQVGK